MNKKQGELLERINAEIQSLQKRKETAVNMGWWDKHAIIISDLIFFETIRDLIKKFFEWPERAGKILDDYFTWDIPFEMEDLLKEIRDFEEKK